MNTEELEQKQTALQEEAHAFLNQLNLVESLSKFGSPTIVGSLASGLMTWPDIDIEVYSDTLPTREGLGEFAKHLFSFPENERIILLDNRQKHYPYYPSGLYIMLQQKKWKADIWFFLNTEKGTGKEYLQKITPKLTPENRKIILTIKSEIAHHPLYRKKIFSVDIYTAVLENGIKNLEEFNEYLKEKNL